MSHPDALSGTTTLSSRLGVKADGLLEVLWEEIKVNSAAAMLALADLLEERDIEPHFRTGLRTAVALKMRPRRYGLGTVPNFYWGFVGRDMPARFMKGLRQLALERTGHDPRDLVAAYILLGRVDLMVQAEANNVGR